MGAQYVAIVTYCEQVGFEQSAFCDEIRVLDGTETVEELIRWSQKWGTHLPVKIQKAAEE